MKILSKGKYSIKSIVENYGENDDSSVDFDEFETIESCQISPNQQNLAIIQKKSKLDDLSKCIYTIIIINIFSKEIIFQSTINSDEELDQVPCYFSIDSQYLAVLIEPKLIIINIFDKSEQRLYQNVRRIISIDSNNILQLFAIDKILHYSLTQKEIVKQIEWNSEDYFIDSISNNIYLVMILDEDFFQIIFQEKILKTIQSKSFFDSYIYDFKYFDQQYLVGYIGEIEQDLEQVCLFDLRTSRILRNFQRDLQIQDQFKSRTITNIKQKQRCFYIFYIDENKQFIRFNLITGVRIKLDFRIKSLRDKVINSENVYVDITNEEKLRYFYFKKQ